MKLDPNKKLDIKELLKDLESYRPRRSLGLERRQE